MTYRGIFYYTIYLTPRRDVRSNEYWYSRTALAVVWNLNELFYLGDNKTKKKRQTDSSGRVLIYTLD